ncbi:hypothetical protein MMC20_005987 [Loxospora ochrophaea]|nr:hypothetical protein [Loxospora ochrophaea]
MLILGKADFLSETPFQTARREAHEEIGLPVEDSKLPPLFRVEHLCELPAILALTELGVRPCVAFLHSGDVSGNTTAETEESLMPRFDAKEVAAVFTAPFQSFLREKDIRGREDESPDWYRGSWTTWNSARSRMHNFYVPMSGQTVARPKNRRPDHVATTASRLEDGEKSGRLKHYRVFGMTARILVDAARIAYNEEPEFEHSSHFGEEDMIKRLQKLGRLQDVKKPGDQLSPQDLEKAAKI